MHHHSCRTFALLTICLLATALIAVPAGAEVRKIPPLSFKPLSPLYDSVCTPLWVGADAGAVTTASVFTAPAKLPGNATIEAVSFYYTAAAGADVSLIFGYYDTAAPDTDLRIIATGSSSADALSPQLVTLAFVPGADLTVRNGYKYLAWAVTPRQTLLWEARVSFTRP